MTAAVSIEGALARLAFWVSSERIPEFEDAYDQRVAPLLKRRGLMECPEPGRAAAEGVFQRLFTFRTAAEIDAEKQALQRDPLWIEVLRGLGGRFGGVGPEQRIRHRFGPYDTPAGPGRSAAAGPGSLQGLWRSFGVADGLPSPIVRAIAEDGEGRLWFGTEGGGVSRFDGREFTGFTTRDGLAGNEVSAVLGDRKGTLWFATKGWGKIGGDGVSCYDGQRLVTLTAADGLAGDTVVAMAEDDEGRLWFGTQGGGVSCYDGERFVTYTVRDGLVYDEVTSLLHDRDGCLWIGTWQGLSRFDGREFTTYTPRDGLPHSAVTDILEDRGGKLWFATWGGVSRLDGHGFTTLTARGGLLDDRVSCLAEDGEGNVWIGTNTGGASRFDGREFSAFTTRDGLANDQIISLLEDRRGYLWFGTFGGGVSCYDKVQFATFTVRDGLPSDGVMSLLEDRAGQLWVGTWAGVCRYDGTRFAPVDAAAEDNVWALVEDAEGGVWFSSTEAGVVRVAGGVLTRFTVRDGLAHDSVLSALRDGRGTVWLGTDGGLSRFDGRSFTSFTTRDGLPTDSVCALLEDRQGRLWLGTSGGGACRFDGQEFVTFSAREGLAHSVVTSLLEDREGRLWFGTWGGGVCRFDGQEFVTFSAREGLAHGVVTSLLEDREGHLWFGTLGGGVYRHDGLVFQTLSRRDGLPSDAVHQILQSENGDVWVSTEGGLARYRPSSTPPTVEIADVIADRHYGPVRDVRLPASQKFLLFQFQGRSWTTSPEQMVYLYCLVGRDADWHVSQLPKAEYEDLAVGEYTFQVRAVDRDLNYSAPVAVTVRVEADPRLVWNEDRGLEVQQFVGRSAVLDEVRIQVERVASTDLTVLIAGETGTGKGLVARSIHRLSPRHSGPLLLVNCGAIPEGLVESELFGHERGAFTSAVSRKLGKVELARGGTLFLDEIGDLAPEAQAKLLRLLEEHSFERVGGTETLRADVRIIAATNRDLKQMVDRELFRADLYFRLQAFPIRLPPLRDRREDIPLLASYFMERMAAQLDKEVTRVSPEALIALRTHEWPGNVRELEHVVQRAVLLCREPEIRAADIVLELGATGGESATGLLTLEELQRRYIREVLDRTGWVVRGTRGAAQVLGLNEATLRYRMKKLGIERSGA